MFGLGCVSGCPGGVNRLPWYTTHHWYSKRLTIKTTHDSSSLRQRTEFRAQFFCRSSFSCKPRYSDKLYLTEIIRKRSRVVIHASTLSCVRTERQRWHFWITPEPYRILMPVLTLGVNGAIQTNIFLVTYSPHHWQHKVHENWVAASNFIKTRELSKKGFGELNRCFSVF